MSESTEKNNTTWTTGHDLALVYLALMHGADDEIDPSEDEVMVDRLADWLPELDEAHLRAVTEEVMLMYVSQAGHEMLSTSVETLQRALSKPQRVAVLNDLAEIAGADGVLYEGEVSFIQQLARHWDLEDDLRASPPRDSDAS